MHLDGQICCSILSGLVPATGVLSAGKTLSTFAPAVLHCPAVPPSRAAADAGVATPSAGAATPSAGAADASMADAAAAPAAALKAEPEAAVKAEPDTDTPMSDAAVAVPEDTAALLAEPSEDSLRAAYLRQMAEVSPESPTA